MYKSVHVRVVHDLRYVLRCANDSFNFPLGLIKYIVIVVIVIPASHSWCVCGWVGGRVGCGVTLCVASEIAKHSALLKFCTPSILQS